MYQIKISKSSLRSSLLLGAASAAVFGIAAPATADEVTTVIVTGSRIPQTGLYSSSPVTAVGKQEMKFEGTTNVENLLNNLPAAFADFGDTASNGSTGTATVNLRNLGSARTLVLIDGKRLMPGDPALPSADLNQIPAALVDHIEVSTGGASAVYGSDAIAGVVNFIMRKDFEGVEADGNYSIYQHNNDSSIAKAAVDHSTFPVKSAPSSVWDGANVDGTVLLGVNSDSGKGNITVYAGYRNTQAVLESQRDFSTCAMNTTTLFGHPPLGPNDLFRCSGSSNSQFLNIRAHNPNVFCPTCAHPASTKAFRSTTTTSFIPYQTARDNFNFAPLNYLQRPDTRYTLGGMGHYEVSKAFDVYTSLMFMDDHTVAQIAPSGWFRGGGSFGGDMLINCDNPFLGNPLNTHSPAHLLCGASAGSSTNVLAQIGRRFVEAGNRQDNLRHTSYRMVVGVKGDLGDGWTYDLFGQYGTTIYAEEYLNDASLSHEQKSLQVVLVGGVPTCKSVIDGSDPSCVPANIFRLGGLTQAAINYIATPGFKEGATEERVLGANLTGDLGQWGVQSPWAKSPVAVSFGLEYRSEFLDYRTDVEFQTGDLAGQGGATPSVRGSFNVAEGFGEVRVPLIQGMPLVEDLTVNGGYRYSSYNLAGKVSSYKYGAEYQPIDDLKFRASFQRAVRAPNVVELFSPQTIGLWGGFDPCGTAPTFNAAQCANTNGGVPLVNFGSSNLDCPAGQCSGLFGGNLNLKPESSDTRSLGLVFTPTFIDGFTATVDYFDIKVSGFIGVINQPLILDACAVSGAASICSLIHRAPGTEILFGNAGFVDSRNQNTGSLENRGIDFEANYQTDMADWGMGDNGGLAFNFVGTWTQRYNILSIPTNFTRPLGLPDTNTDCAGKFGNFCGTPTPRWRHKLRVTWSSPWDVDVSAAWRYMSRVKADWGSFDPADARIPAFSYFDLAGTWTVREGVELHAGVNNIADKAPPILDNSYIATPPFGNGNTFPQVYDALGRFIFVGATVKY
ncbi:MAG: TonB-dependent receptor [Proteobacteria bacterium]|nr:TonB-dependent receptor [Pseudomonadota bacterium]